MTIKIADFGSLEGLAELLEAIGLRLHAKNRIAGGDSTYIWHLAETIRKTGRLASLGADEPQLQALFGDGYDAGTIPEDAQPDRFMALLKEQTNP